FGLVADVEQHFVLVDLDHGARDDLTVLDVHQRAGDGVLEALTEVILGDLAGDVVALCVERAERQIVLGGGGGDGGQGIGFAFGGGQGDARWTFGDLDGSSPRATWARWQRPRLPPSTSRPSACFRRRESAHAPSRRSVRGARAARRRSARRDARGL